MIQTAKHLLRSRPCSLLFNKPLFGLDTSILEKKQKKSLKEKDGIHNIKRTRRLDLRRDYKKNRDPGYDITYKDGPIGMTKTV